MTVNVTAIMVLPNFSFLLRLLQTDVAHPVSFFVRFHESKDHITYCNDGKIAQFHIFRISERLLHSVIFFSFSCSYAHIFRSAHICIIVIAALSKFMHIGDSYSIRLLYILMIFCFLILWARIPRICVK